MNNTTNLLEKQCDNCGEVIFKEKRQLHKGQTTFYCNRKCHNAHKSKINYNLMCERVGKDFKEWLIEQYWDKERPASDLSEEVYGTRKNSPNILGWMKRLDIPTRNRTDAVALQWKDNHERRKQAAKDAVINMGEGSKGREKLISYMQTDEYKDKIAKRNGGENNGMYGVTGESHPKWNPYLTEEERAKKRNSEEYKNWRIAVYKRDRFTCQCCGDKKSGNLVAHHLNGYNWDKKNRHNHDNGVTLCTECHAEFHKIYGYGNNTKKQFEYFQKNINPKEYKEQLALF